MEIPKVIEELIFSYVWAIEHPVCKLLRDEISYGHHADSFLPYRMEYDEEYDHHTRILEWTDYESRYCVRCGEFMSEFNKPVWASIWRCDCDHYL